jgi:putative mRNA 3-end processing factor
MTEDVLTISPAGLFCERGGFHVDPWAPAPLAVITHAHGDHARPGSREYICAGPGAAVMRRRVGPDAPIHAVAYGEQQRLGQAIVSFHPAGHILGSAQVRIETDDGVWVASGDYKRQPDPTCAAFEPVTCDVLITEATFALPIYCWPDPEQAAREIYEWWRANRAANRTSVLFCYALGKAQRILALLRAFTDEPVFLHGALVAPTDLYRAAGVELLPTRPVAETMRGRSFAGELVLAPEMAIGSRWMRRFGDHETAFASGWMRVRGNRRRRSFDRGFELSDHADWPALLRTIDESGAQRVLATHGSSEPLARFLREERDLDAGVIATRFSDAEGEEI